MLKFFSSPKRIVPVQPPDVWFLVSGVPADLEKELSALLLQDKHLNFHIHSDEQVKYVENKKIITKKV